MLLRFRYLFLLIGLIIWSLITGCATVMPASEGLVFEQQESNKNTQNGTTIKFSGVEVRGGIAFIKPFGNLVRAVNNKYGERPYNELNEDFLLSLSMPSFALFLNNRVALGSTAPFPGFWQLDATVRVFNQFYITVSRKIALNNTQILLQRRLLYHKDGGIGLGIFYRYDPLELKRENNRFYISWYGLRSVFQTPAFSNPGYHLRGFINAGYVPEFDVPLIAFGISLVFSIDRE